MKTKTMRKITCIYHSADLDGWMSAAIVKQCYPDAILVGYNYGEPIPKINTDTSVFMIDVSFPADELMQLAKEVSGAFIWIDHHERTINDFIAKFGEEHPPVVGVFPDKGEKVAACELTWRHLYSKGINPEVIRLLGAYDSFRHKGTDEAQAVLNFQYGARALCASPEEAIKLMNVGDKDIEMVKKIGAGIHQYLCKTYATAYKKGFVLNFDGFRFITVNSDRFNPINFGIDYHADGYDGAASFWYEKGKWIFSLYNDNGLVDCSIICKKRGGGGHSGASGFQTTDIGRIIP